MGLSLAPSQKKIARVPTILASVVERLVVYGVQAGLQRGVLLREGGLTESAFADQERRLPIHCVYALLAYMSEALDDRAIALSMAGAARPEELRMLGFALMTAASGREAFDRLIASFCLVTDSGQWSYTEHEDSVEVRWQRPDPKSKGLLVANEVVIATFVQYVRMAAPDCAPLRIMFSHTAPAEIAPYEDFFRSPIRFSAAHDGLVYPLRILAMRPRTEGLAIGEFLGRMTDAATSQLIGAADPIDQLQQAIRDDLADGAPDMERIAARLGTSQRTLRRRLEQDGVRFRDLVHQVRRAYAEELLGRSELSVADVALKLGFSEAPAFSRAFRRWTGEAPLQFRKRVSRS